MPLVFAYGSNLNVARMVERCPSAEVFSRAYLPDFSLLFESNGRGRVVANVMRDTGDFVDGVVYEISAADLKVLDSFEGYPFVYNRARLRVRCDDGMVPAWVYIMEDPMIFSVWDEKTRKWRRVKVARRAARPQDAYLQHLQIGYRQFGFDQRRLKFAMERKDVR